MLSWVVLLMRSHNQRMTTDWIRRNPVPRNPFHWLTPMTMATIWLRLWHLQNDDELVRFYQKMMLDPSFRQWEISIVCCWKWGRNNVRFRISKLPHLSTHRKRTNWKKIFIQKTFAKRLHTKRKIVETECTHMHVCTNATEQVNLEWFNFDLPYVWIFIVRFTIQFMFVRNFIHAVRFTTNQ